LAEYPESHRAALLALVTLGLQHCSATEGAAESWRKGLLSSEILAQLGLDSDTLAAALLHPVIASQPACAALFQPQLSPKASRMLDALLRLRQLRPSNPTDAAQTEKLRRLLLALAADLRVMLIRIAEQLRDLRAARDQPTEDRLRLAQETQMIYAPLANRLGLGQIKWELEDWTFRYLSPDIYADIARLLDERRLDREHYIAQTVAQIQEKLAEQNISAEVKGRPKHIYSIWRKMQRKGVGFSQILDVRAVRVTVETVAQCYQVLGLVHSLWRPVPGEFDDYIAAPKSNGYRSLHTAIIGSDGKPLEIQIRTRQMHQHAEQGVAAHWRYKEGNSANDYEALLARLRHWLEQEPDARVLNEGLAGEVLAERVYVFTPKSQIIELPRGATVLDFAYHIHSDIGHRCRGAKVNGRIAPLTTALENGHTVEILTGSQPAPSHDWLTSHLGFLRTPKARAQVRQWFRLQNKEQNIQIGQEILHRETRNLGLAQIDWPLLLKRFNLVSQSEVQAALGRGDISLVQLANALADQVLPPESVTIHHRPHKTEARTSAVQVQGVGNLLTQMAKCCKPVPGDAIAGYITLGHGVTIHRADCSRLLELGATRHERLIEVDWGQPADNALYNVDISVIAHDRPGLLRDIGNLLANEKINATAVQTQNNNKNSTANMRLTLELSNVVQLAKVLDRINQLANVIEARRLH
jgi:GTP pyrophosphokinase